MSMKINIVLHLIQEWNLFNVVAGTSSNDEYLSKINLVFDN